MNVQGWIAEEVAAENIRNDTYVINGCLACRQPLGDLTSALEFTNE